MGVLTAVWRTPERRFWLLACLLALYLGLTKGDGGMLDLKVYRRGAEFVAAGDPLYDLRPGKLPFTYPPFAAIFMMPIAAVPWVWAVKIWTGVSVPGLAAVLRQSAPRAVATRSILMPLALLGCLALEPVRATLRFGQINLILAAMIMLDLVGRKHPGR
ncbi:MAG: alpha,2-mannosyltransferase, partial [Mycobacterium sp.]|nr:alpha,2-mannosyltransferase [Mycobacterium sp.]